MSITQTVEIPAQRTAEPGVRSRRQLTIDIPDELPGGTVILTFTPAKNPSDQRSEARDIEIINRNAERLNQEAMDVLRYQVDL